MGKKNNIVEVNMKNLNAQTKKSIIISAVIFIILVIGGIFFYTRSVDRIRRECNKVNQEMSDRINGASRVVYRAITDIGQGQVISADLVQAESDSLSDTVQGLLMDSGDVGKVARVDINAGEDIHKSMVGDVLDKNWQETEMNCIWLSTNLKQYDYVDIRILFPNGTDYIVASKKCIKSVKLSKNNAFFWMSEDEILNLDAAIVDANLHRAKIYTTKYVDSALEPANVVTYQPSDAVIDLLNSDPNVLAEAKENLSKTARAEMEDKLEQFKEDYTERQKEELDKGYNFHLDTNTSAGTGEVSENNNGSTEPDTDSTAGNDSTDGSSPAPIDSSRNEVSGDDGGGQ